MRQEQARGSCSGWVPSSGCVLESTGFVGGASAPLTCSLISQASGDLERDVRRRTQEDGSDWSWACTWMEPLVNREAHLLTRSYYLLDRQTLPEGAQNKQTMRAAVLTMRLLDFMKRVGNSTIPCRGLMSRAHPAPKIVPRCVQAFDTLFATSIEPADGAEATVNMDALLFTPGFAH
jgi:hypothetical protein